MSRADVLASHREAQRRYLAKPEKRELHRQQNRAQRRALTRLKRLFPEAYELLYADEIQKQRGDV